MHLCHLFGIWLSLFIFANNKSQVYWMKLSVLSNVLASTNRFTCYIQNCEWIIAEWNSSHLIIISLQFVSSRAIGNTPAICWLGHKQATTHNLNQCWTFFYAYTPPGHNDVNAQIQAIPYTTFSIDLQLNWNYILNGMPKGSYSAWYRVSRIEMK